MIGPVRRPSFATMKLDWRGMQLLGKLGLRAGRGDDRLFQAIVGELEAEGFRVVGADEVMGTLLGARRAADPGGARRGGARATSPRASRWPRASARSTSARRWWCSMASCSGSRRSRAPTGCSPAAPACAARARAGFWSSSRSRRRSAAPICRRSVRRPSGRRPPPGSRAIAVEAGQCLIIEQQSVVELADRDGLFVLGVDVVPAWRPWLRRADAARGGLRAGRRAVRRHARRPPAQGARRAGRRPARVLRGRRAADGRARPGQPVPDAGAVADRLRRDPAASAAARPAAARDGWPRSGGAGRRWC